MSDYVPSVRLSIEKNRATVFFFGKWLLLFSQPNLIQIFSEIAPAQCSNLTLDCIGVEKWDTSFVKIISQIKDFCNVYHIDLNTESVPAGVMKLLAMCYRADSPILNKDLSNRKIYRHNSIFYKCGAWFKILQADLKNIFDFTGNVVLSIGRLFLNKAQFRRVDMINCVQEVGVDALPIVALISFLVGLILAFISIVQLKKFGASIYVADLIAISMTREMGALMTAIIMAGRTGAAFASTIGSMSANDEVDALKTMGFSVFDFLVMPKIVALIIMMPLLCVFADLIGMMGGMFVSMYMTDISISQYILQSQESINVYDLLSGVSKSCVFGVLIAGIGCLRGIQCGRSAESVGNATTSAVVTSITAIIVADAVFAVIFDAVGI